MFIFTVQQNEEVVLTTFGRHSGTKQKPGICFKWPWQKRSKPVSKKIVEKGESIKTKTSDNIFVTIPVVMHIKVVDSAKSVFVAEDPIAVVKSAVVDTVKGVVSKTTLEELFSERQAIREQVKEQVKAKIAEYGYALDNVIIEEPSVPEAVEERYNRAKSSEQELIERTNLAEAKKREIVADAEGKKEASRLLGEGIAAQRSAIFENYAEQLKKLGQSVSEEEAIKIMALAMSQDTLRDIGENGNLIISTTNAKDMLAEFQALGRNMTDKLPHNNDNMIQKAVTPTHQKPGS